MGYQIHFAGDKSMGRRIEKFSGGNGAGTGNFNLTVRSPVTLVEINMPLPDSADVLIKFLLEKYLESSIPFLVNKLE
jgi:hypothetical protein